MMFLPRRRCSGGFSIDLPLRVVIAGGGTGGHVFPGIALAQAFCDRNPENRILFVGTGNRFEQRIFSATPFFHTAVSVEGIKGRGMLQKFRAVAKVPGGVLTAMGILNRFGAQLVVGVGGYSSAPVVMAARIMGIPVVLQEQNLIPGLANRLLGRLAQQIHVSFARTRPGFDEKKIRVSGNPVREEVVAALQPVTAEANDGKASADRFTVLVCGGSQGAQAINRAMIEALPYLKENSRLFFIHQTGEAGESAVRSAYLAEGISVRVAAFFTDMADQYAEANLVVCRSGATTIAELTALGKPALFIPYPYAADQHQRLNAELLADGGAAEVMLESALTGRGLADRLLYYVDHLDVLAAMADRSRKLGRPNAAANIVSDCYRLLGGCGTDQENPTG